MNKKIILAVLLVIISGLFLTLYKPSLNLKPSGQTYINEKGQVWGPLPKGKQNFEIVSGAGGTFPKFTEAEIDPLDVKPGDIQKFRVVVQDNVEVSEVIAEIETDNGTTTVPLKLTSQSAVSQEDFKKQKYIVEEGKLLLRNDAEFSTKLSSLFETVQAAGLQKFIYEGQWVVHDTHSKIYKTVFTAKNIEGKSNSIRMAWSDPCNPPPIGNWAVNSVDSGSTCSSINGVENGNLSFDSDCITGGCNITFTSTFVFNNGFSINLANNGRIIIGSGGQIKESNLWIKDADFDGYLDGVSDNCYGNTSGEASVTCGGSGWTRRGNPAPTTVGPSNAVSAITGSGAPKAAWLSPTSILSSDNVYSTAAIDTNGSHVLSVSNFGLNIPFNSKITGIRVDVEKMQSAGGTIEDAPAPPTPPILRWSYGNVSCSSGGCSVLNGSGGFTVVRNGVGDFTVTFSSGLFTNNPAVAVNPYTMFTAHVVELPTYNSGTNQYSVRLRFGGRGTSYDSSFSLIALGLSSTSNFSSTSVVWGSFFYAASYPNGSVIDSGQSGWSVSRPQAGRYNLTFNNGVFTGVPAVVGNSNDSIGCIMNSYFGATTQTSSNFLYQHDLPGCAYQKEAGGPVGFIAVGPGTLTLPSSYKIIEGVWNSSLSVIPGSTGNIASVTQSGSGDQMRRQINFASNTFSPWSAPLTIGSTNNSGNPPYFCMGLSCPGFWPFNMPNCTNDGTKVTMVSSGPGDTCTYNTGRYGGPIQFGGSLIAIGRPAYTSTYGINLCGAKSGCSSQVAITGPWPTTETVVSYGDIWYIGTNKIDWVPEEVNGSNLSVQISAKASSGSATAYIDSVRVTVFYSTPVTHSSAPDCYDSNKYASWKQWKFYTAPRGSVAAGGSGDVSAAGLSYDFDCNGIQEGSENWSIFSPGTCGPSPACAVQGGVEGWYGDPGCGNNFDVQYPITCSPIEEEVGCTESPGGFTTYTQTCR